MSESAPPPGFAADPTLEILWGPPPAYVGAPPTQGAGPPSNDMFMASPLILVNLATMMAAEQGTLSSATVVVNAYNPLKQQVQSAITGGTIFGQQATENTRVNGKTQTGGNGHSYTPQYDVTEADTQLQQAAQQFAEQINPMMTRVLRMIADATESVGVYIALLDKAGQAYTSADKSSALPPTPPPGS